MRVYCGNTLRYHTALYASPEPLEGYDMKDLHHPFLSRVVRFPANTVTINVGWGAGVYADSIAILGCDFDQASVGVASQGAAAYAGVIQTRGAHTVTRLPDACMATWLTLTIHASAPVKIGGLYVGLKTEFPRFDASPTLGYTIIGEGARSSYGQAYGVKKPGVKTFAAAWTRIDNLTRAAMEAYADAVQGVEPHLIEPYDDYSVPPMYATLANLGEFAKRPEDGFFWSASMSFEEAK
jgi:hypothetical protein